MKIRAISINDTLLGEMYTLQHQKKQDNPMALSGL